MSRSAVGALCAVVAFSPAACGAPVPVTGPELEYLSIAELEADARARGWDEQAAILADGVVTRAEYEQALDDTRACAERDGNGITDPVLSPIDNLTLEFGFPQGAMTEDDVWEMSDQRLQRYFWSVQNGYQSTHDAAMDADILGASLSCMRERGHTIAGEVTNAGQMAVQVSREGELELAECISESAMRLRPDREGIGVFW